VLYTDNTTSITARNIDAERMPLAAGELDRWLDCEMQLYQRAIHICVRANVVKRSLVDDYKVPAEKISVIGGGVNFAQLPQMIEREAKAAPTLLFVGTDFHRKGGDLVLQAFSRVRKVIPSAQLVVVTQDLIPAGLSLEGVRVLAPIWDRAEVESLYRKADVFILPSRLETWGDVLLEAMAFGLPCIGVRGQAMEDIIVHGETGFLVAPEQAGLLSEAIIQLFERPDLRYQMGQAASLLVAQEFTWDRVVERLAPILDTAARKSPVSSCFSSLERMSV
jgi:glycosyltransferase involved in cell wall biosynthesis